MENNPYWQPMEPTERDPIYVNEYMVGIPPPPPPPQKPRRSLVVLIVSLVIAVLLFASAGLFYLARTSAVNRAQSTPTAPAVLVTPTQQAATAIATTQPTTGQTNTQLAAVDIYNRLASQLDTSTHHIVSVGYDTVWGGWPYTPERQAFVWHDNGSLYEIAAFTNSSEATADSNYNPQVNGNKYGTTVIGTCLFLFDSTANRVTTSDYLSLLNNQPGCV
jgi:hypothetical protein